MVKMAPAWAIVGTTLASLVVAAVARRSPALEEAVVTGQNEASRKADPSDARARNPRLRAIERTFETDRSGGGRESAERQRALDGAVREAIEGLDADVSSAECRDSACRVDATFDSTGSSNEFFERAFMRTSASGDLLFEHGGVYAVVLELVGGRHHSVFYAVKKPMGG